MAWHRGSGHNRKWRILWGCWRTEMSARIKLISQWKAYRRLATLLAAGVCVFFSLSSPLLELLEVESESAIFAKLCGLQICFVALGNLQRRANFVSTKAGNGCCFNSRDCERFCDIVKNEVGGWRLEVGGWWLEVGGNYGHDCRWWSCQTTFALVRYLPMKLHFHAIFH